MQCESSIRSETLALRQAKTENETHSERRPGLKRDLAAVGDQTPFDFQAYTDARILELPPETLSDQLRERREFLLRQRQGNQLPGASRAKREPTQRRPRRAGRAETARMAAELPPCARVDQNMTNAAVRVYRTLWRLADEGCNDPSVPEIADRALCHVRAVQFALEALKTSGHLVVMYRRVRPGMNATNIYQLTYHRRAISAPAARGEKICGVKRKKDSVSTLTVGKGCSSERSAPGRRAESNRKIASFEGSARKLRTIPGKAMPRAQRRAGFDPDVGRLALISLKAQGVTDNLDAHDCDAICAAVDGLRRTRFPGFSPGYWERSVGRLGFAAYLAVIEVAELAAVKQIHNMTAYLGGVLRKPADEVRPDVTLTRLQYSAAA
jgi:hypothetical protein